MFIGGGGGRRDPNANIEGLSLGLLCAGIIENVKLIKKRNKITYQVLVEVEPHRDPVQTNSTLFFKDI